MSDTPRELEGETTVRIRRGRVDSVDLYEIKDSELDQLEKGSPADLQLNFGVFVLSLAFAAICSLATATFTNATVHELFLIVAVGGTLAGLYLLISWFRNRVSNRELCERIRKRIPPDIAPANSVAIVAPGPDEAEQPKG